MQTISLVPSPVLGICLIHSLYLLFFFSLLKEAEFHAEQREYELNRRRQLGLSSSHHSLDNTDYDNKDDDKHDQRLLSQFGIWFLVSMLCCFHFLFSPSLDSTYQCRIYCERLIEQNRKALSNKHILPNSSDRQTLPCLLWVCEG